MQVTTARQIKSSGRALGSGTLAQIAAVVVMFAPHMLGGLALAIACATKNNPAILVDMKR
jgi:hypothetical protein